jgi:uracil-DNA glycosylase
MITDPFDSGPTGTVKTLCQKYPDDTVFSGADGFRSLWGPIFYRGRANGTARLLVIGQDPAETEAVTRRILSGQAGRRVQGFVEKLGYSKSYLMINAFLFGIYNQSMAVPAPVDPTPRRHRAPGRLRQRFHGGGATGDPEPGLSHGAAVLDALLGFLGEHVHSAGQRTGQHLHRGAVGTRAARGWFR